MLDFLGIGAQKAGTTWVYANLGRNPAVSFPGHKEVHFWNKHYDRGVEWYKNLFTQDDGTLKGDITPAYGFLPKERIEEIHQHYPDVPLLYLTRNPLERAWSGALMALGRAEMEIGEASDQWFIDHFRSAGSQARGDYEACIRTWQGVYPKQQLLVMQYEDIKADPLATMTRICQHIGLDAGFYAAQPELLSQRHNEGGGHPLRPTLKRFLQDLYREKVERLKTSYGIDYTGVLA